MMSAASVVARRQVTCANGLCPQIVRMKRPQWLGEVLGVEAHLPCPRCHQTTHWRAPLDNDAIARVSSTR